MKPPWPISHPIPIALALRRKGNTQQSLQILAAACQALSEVQTVQSNEALCRELTMINGDYVCPLFTINVTIGLL